MLSCSPPVSSPFVRERKVGEEGRFGDGSKGDNNAVFLDWKGR